LQTEQRLFLHRKQGVDQTMNWNHLRILVCLACVWSPACAVHQRAVALPPPAQKFVSISRGNSLAGWSAVPQSSAGDWSIRDGVITGRGSVDRLSYLVWKDELENFDLRFEYRMVTKGNTGVEVRAHRDATGKRPFEGYHADLGHVGIGPQVLGAWDFHFARRREPPCHRGTSLTIEKDGRLQSKPIPGAVKLSDIRKHDWNSARILAVGSHLQFFINGKLAAEFSDNVESKRLKRGIIGLQLHDKGMHVEFKNMQLKRLPASSATR